MVYCDFDFFFFRLVMELLIMRIRFSMLCLLLCSTFCGASAVFRALLALSSWCVQLEGLFWVSCVCPLSFMFFSALVVCFFLTCGYYIRLFHCLTVHIMWNVSLCGYSSATEGNPVPDDVGLNSWGIVGASAAK